MQGFNMGRYHPPDDDSSHHRLKRRALSSSSTTPPTIRFEMPFALWCAHCPKPTLIPQGVRFNAAKRRVGAYHSTPIWSFVLKHADCGGEIEMRTDPANADFVVVRGARRRDYGDLEKDALVASAVAPTMGLALTPRQREEERETAFGRLEKTIADRERLVTAAQRIEELREEGQRKWEDPYTQNQRLRKAFRAGRHAREREEKRTEELRARLGGIGIELLPETEEDVRRARLVDFGSSGVANPDNGDEGAEDLGSEALIKPLFPSSTATTPNKSATPTSTTKPTRKLKSELKALRTRESLAVSIATNTRAARDPFLDFGNSSSSSSNKPGAPLLPGLKRKRVVVSENDKPPDPHPAAPPPPSSTTSSSAAAESASTASGQERSNSSCGSSSSSTPQPPKSAAGTTPLVDYASDSE
ncbi:hypothetical protein VTJ04DRAFT_6600 [Mycothermus thermophilus]|uniref:uncharacterized protein n=1 Tax=Humicola insolens TaxID=85995 RepID=UPI003743E692